MGKKYCSRFCLVKGQPIWNKGKKIFQISGKNHWNWQGGISKYIKKGTKSPGSAWALKKWREKSGKKSWNEHPKISIICKFCEKETLIRYYERKWCFFCSKFCSSNWKKTLKEEKSWSWKGGSEFWKKRDYRNDGAYQHWVNTIKQRDNRQCQINNKDCSGYCEIHHILRWSAYPEERYNIKNGITLCHFHHPRKRVDEEKLIPFFQNLVKVK